MSDQEPTTIRIGEILERAGLVTPGDLSEAVSVSKRLAMPIGRILIMSGCVTEGLLKAALDAQQMLRERQISIDTAIETLIKVADEKTTFQQALERTDPQHLAGSTTSKLGEILIEFGLLDETLLRQATVRSLETGMPLGTTLVTMNLLSPALLPAVLRASDQIRSGEVAREVAIEEFRSSYDMWVKAKESFKQGGSDSELQTAQGQGRASNAQVTSSGPHAAQEEYFRRMAAMGHPGAYQPLPYPNMPPAYPPQYAPAPPPYGASGFPGNPADWAVSGAPGYSPAPQWPGYPQQQGPNWQQAYPPQPAPHGYMQPPNAPAWAPHPQAQQPHQQQQPQAPHNQPQDPHQQSQAPHQQPQAPHQQTPQIQQQPQALQQQPPAPPQQQPQIPQQQPQAPQSSGNNGAPAYPFPGVRPGASYGQPQAEQQPPQWQGQQPPQHPANQYPSQHSSPSHNGFDASANVVNYSGSQHGAYPGAHNAPAQSQQHASYPGVPQADQPQQTSGQYEQISQSGAYPQTQPTGAPTNYSSPSQNGLGSAHNAVDPNVVSPQINHSPAASAPPVVTPGAPHVEPFQPAIEARATSSQTDTPSQPFSPVSGPIQLTPGMAPKAEAPAPPLAENPAAPPTKPPAEFVANVGVQSGSFTPQAPSKSSTRSEDGLPAFERVISRQMKTQPTITEVTPPKPTKKKRSGDKTTTRKALSIKTEDNEIVETESGDFPPAAPAATPKTSHFKLPSSMSSISGEYRQLGSNPFSLAPVKPNTGEHDALPSNQPKISPVAKAEESSETISKLSDAMLESKQTFFDWGPAEQIPSSIFPRDESIEKTPIAAEIDQQPPTVLTWGPQPEVIKAEVNIPSTEGSSEQSKKTTDFDSGLSISVAPFAPQQNTDSANTVSASTNIAPPESVVAEASNSNNSTLSAAEPSQGSFNLSSPSVLGKNPDIYPDMTHAAPEMNSVSVDLSATAPDAHAVRMPLTRGIANTLVGVETQADLPSIDGSNDNAIEARATLSFKVESDFFSSNTPIDPTITTPDLPVVTVSAIGAVALTSQDRSALLEKVSDSAIKNWHIQTPPLNPVEIGGLDLPNSPITSEARAPGDEKPIDESAIGDESEGKNSSTLQSASVGSEYLNKSEEELSQIESAHPSPLEAMSEMLDESAHLDESAPEASTEAVSKSDSEDATASEPVNSTSFAEINEISISMASFNESAGEKTFTDLKPIELPPIELPPIEVNALGDLPEDVVADISELRNELLSEFSKVIDIQEGKKHSRLTNGKSDADSQAIDDERAKSRRAEKKSKKGKNGKPFKEELEADIEDAVASLHKQLEELPIELVAEPATDEPAAKTSKSKNKSKKAGKTDSRKATHHVQVDLIDVLKTAGLFSQNDLNTAFNNALADPAMHATLLNALGILNPQIIECGVRCQSMLANGELKPQQVSFLLGVVRNGKSFDEALHELGLSTAAAV